jgi:uncharacterized protein (TIGR02265 family)
VRPTEELVYSNTFEGLRLALSKHGVPPGDIDEAFRGIGVHFKKPLPAYSKQHFIDSLQLSVKLAFPDSDAETAFRKVGSLVIEGYIQTVLGRAVHAAAQLMGPSWTLKRMTRSLRTSDNCTETRVDEHGPADLSIWINDALGCRGYYEGVFERVVLVSGGKAPRCVVERTAPPRQATYRVTWAAS